MVCLVRNPGNRLRQPCQKHQTDCHGQDAGPYGPGAGIVQIVQERDPWEEDDVSQRLENMPVIEKEQKIGLVRTLVHAIRPVEKF